MQKVRVVPKLKQICSFYSIACRIDSAYNVLLPTSVRNLLDSTSFLSLNVGSLGVLPTECLGLDSFFRTRLEHVCCPAFKASVRDRDNS